MLNKKVLDGINYYLDVTGKNVADFLDGLDSLKEENISTMDYDDWLRFHLYQGFKNDVTLEELNQNKDLLMDSSKELTGDFYTPPIWVEETRQMMERHIPNYRDYIIYDGACGTGNLLEAFQDCKAVYGSSLFEEDCEIAGARFPKTTFFQLDFLSSVDSIFESGMLDKFPEGLRSAILNNEKIIFLQNPPYATSEATKTYVGKYLLSIAETNQAGDLLKQFIWQTYNLIDVYKLTNSYLCQVGTCSLFMLPSWEASIRVLQENATFLEGFAYPATEFAGTSPTMQWGIYTILCKNKTFERVNSLSDMTLTKKKNFDGVITDCGEVTYNWTDEGNVAKWLTTTATGRKMVVPMVNSRGDIKFKGETTQISQYYGLENAYAYIMSKGIFKDISQYNGISTLPMIGSSIPVTESNLIHALGYFMFTTSFKDSFDFLVRPFYKPATDTQEYLEWCANAVYYVGVTRKSFGGTIKDVKIGSDSFTFRDKLFILSKDEVKKACQECNNSLILQDVLKDVSNSNVNYLNLLDDEKIQSQLLKEMLSVFNFVKSFMLSTIPLRVEGSKDIESLGNWDTSFYLLKCSDYWTEDHEKEYTKLYNELNVKLRELQPTHYIV